jgi:hypothetical protein
MSVTCAIYGASDREVEALLRSPETIHDFLRNALPVQRPGCIGTFLGHKPRVLAPTRPYLDLGTSWGAVHFVLTGTDEEAALPNGFITSGGESIGDEDVGYGPARALMASQVRSVAQALESLDIETFRARIDGKKMRPHHVYGAPATDHAKGAQYLVDDYEALRKYLIERGALGEAIVIQYV